MAVAEVMDVVAEAEVEAQEVVKTEVVAEDKGVEVETTAEVVDVVEAVAQAR